MIHPDGDMGPLGWVNPIIRMVSAEFLFIVVVVLDGWVSLTAYLLMLVLLSYFGSWERVPLRAIVMFAPSAFQIGTVDHVRG